jgi:type VI secretion system protein ImpM
MLPSTEVGFYGKLPSHGDFLKRRVSDAFIATWDGWLQECLAATRETLGDNWLKIYLTSPAWRFACAAGALGPNPVVGVMVPSVDRVGRYFYLAIVAELLNGADPLVAATKANAFFDAAEQLAIETLEQDPVDFERFDDDVAQLTSELDAFEVGAVALDGSAAEVLAGIQGGQWQIPLGTPPRPGDVLDQLLSRHLSALYEPLVLWWTGGSAIVEPSFLVSKGLPDPNSFAALLDGAWSSRQWRRVTGHVADTAIRAADADLNEMMPPRFRSAAASDVGRVRSVNQDSYLENSDAGIWVVADGLGGHENGEVASRMVCDALSDLVPSAGFEEMISDAQERIQRVNEQLVREAMHSQNGVGSGSTVVARLARPYHF